VVLLGLDLEGKGQVKGCAYDRALSALNKIAATACTTSNEDGMLDQALALALEAMELKAGVILLLDEATNTLVSHAHQGWQTRDSAVQDVQVPADQGPLGTVMAAGQPLVLQDTAHDAQDALPQLVDEGTQTIVLAPMRARKRVLGVLGVTSYEPREFSPEEMTIISALAEQIAIAVDSARLNKESRRRTEELTVLDEVALAVTSRLDLEQVAVRVTNAVQRGLDSANLHLLLVNDRLHKLEQIGDQVDGGTFENELRDSHVDQDIVGWVIEHGAPLRVGDTPRDLDYAAESPGLRSILAVPLMVGDRIIGVLYASSSRPDAFGRDDERLMITVARQLAFAIENARLHQETERRLTEVSALYELARQMSTSLDVQEVLDSIVWSLKQAVGCRACSIALLEPVEDVLEIRAAAGIEDRWKQDFSLRLGEGIAGRVALEGKPIYVPDVLELGDFIFFDPSVRSLLTVPLTMQQRVIGTLSVDSDQPLAFSEADERLLTVAATQAAVAIEKARLYANLEQRAKNLAEAYAELKEADRLKDEVVQNVSHELRTPLTFVKGYVQLLLEGNAGELTDEQKDYLAIVAEKTDVITDMVSDIMFLQQADQVPGNMKPVSLTKVAWRALRGCAATAEKANLTLVEHLPDDLPQVAGNEARLLQVFDNLLGNAIKFSPDGGRIVVTVEDAGQMVQASVSDQGIGIPKDQQDKVFERFYQVNGSARRRFSGVGLGLAIVKRIVETHGGQVWVESKPRKGSTFYFTIPKHQA
jgi:signal transduction histidine kinase